MVKPIKINKHKKAIKVSAETRKSLVYLKEELNLKTFDDVIQHFLIRAEVLK